MDHEPYQWPNLPPAAPTVVPAAPTAVPTAPTAVPTAPTVVPAAPTVVPAAPTAVPAAPTAVPAAPTAVPAAPTAVPAAPTAVPAAPTAVRAAPTAVPAATSASADIVPSAALAPVSGSLTTAGHNPSTAASQTASEATKVEEIVNFDADDVDAVMDLDPEPDCSAECYSADCASDSDGSASENASEDEACEELVERSNSLSSEWKARYGEVVWAFDGRIWWPGYICDPCRLNSRSVACQIAKRASQTEFVVQFYGMDAGEDFTCVEHTGLQKYRQGDPLYRTFSKQKVSKRRSQMFRDALNMADRDVAVERSARTQPVANVQPTAISRNSWNSKKDVEVEKLDAAGNVVDRYPNQRAAAEAMNTSQYFISKWCNTQGIIPGKFMFRYSTEPAHTGTALSREKRGGASKAIEQLDVDGHVVHRYESQITAAYDLDVQQNMISMCCRDKVASLGGFRFRKYSGSAQMGKICPFVASIVR